MDWADEIAASLIHEGSSEGYDGCFNYFNEASEDEIAAALRAAELRGRVKGMREAVSVAFNCAHDYAMAVDGGESRNSKNIDHALGANKAAQLIHAAATKLESSPTT